MTSKIMKALDYCRCDDYFVLSPAESRATFFAALQRTPPSKYYAAEERRVARAPLRGRTVAMCWCA